MPTQPLTPVQGSTPVPGSAAPAWALEPPQPLAYHRMARIEWRVAQWWRPLATLGVALTLALLAFIAWIIVAFALTAAGWKLSKNFDDATRPADLLVMLGPLATLVPIAVTASWWGAGRRSSIHSVTGRFRWALFVRASRVVVPLYAVLLLAPPLLFGRDDMTVPHLSGSLIACYVFIIVLTPLQCAGEEYIFRGLGMQAFGTWLKSPLWGIVIPTPLFMLGHGYDWVGQIDIACFAVCMGALAWKSGGLELPVLVHMSNNTFSFLLAPFVPGALAQGEVDPWSLSLSLPLLFAVTVGLWVWVSRRYGLSWRQPVMRRPGPQTEPIGRWL